MELIDRTSFKNKDIIKNCIIDSSNIKDFVHTYIEKVTYESIQKTLGPIYCSKLIRDYFKCTDKEILQIFLEKYGIIKTLFGNIRWFNGHVCRSDGEFKIASFLKNNNIEYQYEKTYHGTNYRTDFYLVKQDIYIEYLGMLKNKICRDKYNIKLKKLNTFDIIYSDNINIIIKNIKQIC